MSRKSGFKAVLNFKLQLNDGRVPYRDSFGNRDLSHLSMMSGGLGIRLSLY